MTEKNTSLPYCALIFLFIVAHKLFENGHIVLNKLLKTLEEKLAYLLLIKIGNVG